MSRNKRLFSLDKGRLLPVRDIVQTKVVDSSFLLMSN